MRDEHSFSETSSATKLTLDNISINEHSFNNISLPRRRENLMTNVQNILSEEDQKLKAEMTENLRRKKLFKTLPFPTSDSDVKSKLREIGKPICLFGEKALDRRERLKKEIHTMIMETGQIPEAFTKSETRNYSTEKMDNEVFYTEGSQELKEARMNILNYSIPRAAFRIEVAKKKFMELDRIQESIEYEEFLQRNKDHEFFASQLGDERGCSRGSLSPDDKLFAVAGWSGDCSIINVPEMSKMTTLKGHKEKVNSVAFHPNYPIIPAKGPNLATGSCDGIIKIWSLMPERESQLSTSLLGHEDRVNFVDFHPSGNYLASTSHDKTWRLWDIETKKELLLQEGHSGAVFPLSFQQDGALLATGDLNGIGLIWDLRSGRLVMPLIGHVKRLMTIKFSPNCYTVATGSDDNTLRIWDLRRRLCTHTIPAHLSLISDISFEHSEGKFLMTASHDSTFKMWNNRDWSLVKTYSAGEGKFHSISLTKDNKNIITTSDDRTVKLFSIL
jgi:U4/U6 small nuclear ribonucleoprotein PRP4